MCGNGENGLGIIVGLIAAAAMLMAAFAERHSSVRVAQPAQHAVSATHVALELRPVTLDIDLANARVVVDVSL